MPSLQLPTPEVRESFLAAMDEFAAEGRGAPHDHTMIGYEIQTFGGTWRTTEGFVAFVRSLRADAFEETPRPVGWVPCTTWWWLGNDGYLGRIALRHKLTERLLREGGHIGYDVRPTARRRGHATAMLCAVLPEAAARGISSGRSPRCGQTPASAKVIQANGKAQIQNELDGKLRFVPTDMQIRPQIPTRLHPHPQPHSPAAGTGLGTCSSACPARMNPNRPHAVSPSGFRGEGDCGRAYVPDGYVTSNGTYSVDAASKPLGMRVATVLEALVAVRRGERVGSDAVIARPGVSPSPVRCERSV
jgi:predicted acetyltransferase